MCTWIYMYMYLNTFIYTHTHIYTCICIFIYIHKHIYMSIYICIFIYTCQRFIYTCQMYYRTACLNCFLQMLYNTKKSEQADTYGDLLVTSCADNDVGYSESGVRDILSSWVTELVSY